MVSAAITARPVLGVGGQGDCPVCTDICEPSRDALQRNAARENAFTFFCHATPVFACQIAVFSAAVEPNAAP
jgi:hypothetical protein